MSVKEAVISSIVRTHLANQARILDRLLRSALDTTAPADWWRLHVIYQDGHLPAVACSIEHPDLFTHTLAAATRQMAAAV